MTLPLLQQLCFLLRLSMRRSRKSNSKRIRRSVLFPLLRSYSIAYEVALYPLYLSQAPEPRPEVRFLEYSEIPGITINRRLLKFQKVASSAKKAKIDHMNSGGRSNFRSCMVSFLLIKSCYLTMLLVRWKPFWSWSSQSERRR